MNNREKKVILLVEDERVTARTVTHTLEKHDYLVLHASSGEEAVATAENCERLDLLLTDIDLGGGIDGSSAAEKILNLRNIPALFLSSHTESAIVEKTEKITSYGYILKNSGETVLITSLNMAFKLFDAHEQIKSQKLELESSSKKMQFALKEISSRNEELINAHKELIKSEEKFRNIFETMTIGYFRTSLDGKFLDLNPASLRIFGYESLEEAKRLLNNNSKNVYADIDEWLRIRKNVSDKTFPGTCIVQFLKKDGSRFLGNISLRHIHSSDKKPLHIEGLIEDVTERIKTQEILIQSEKMITVAGLAAGMAHEINNPLGIIMQNAENAKNRIFGELSGNISAAIEAGTNIEAVRRYAVSRKISNYLDEIHEAGARGAKIVNNMLQFSRRTESKLSYININSLMDKAIELATNDYDLKKNYDFRKISIITNYGILPEIGCQETQIEQVFLNILKNAAQAMSGKKFQDEIPTLKINTYSLDGSITIKISDNGLGMEEATRKKIFEPFYTTKEPGKGTGLGLSVSFYIIVDGHHGTITAESSIGAGTSFIITLPEIHNGK